jgi:chaperonin GroES
MKYSNDSGLKVTGDKILVRLHKVEEKTSGGIILAGSTQEKEQMAQQIGTLVDWGDQAKDAPELKGITLGDTLLFHRYTGAHFPVDGVDYWIMKSSQILGKATKLPDFVIKGADSSLQHFPANNPLAA